MISSIIVVLAVLAVTIALYGYVTERRSRHAAEVKGRAAEEARQTEASLRKTEVARAEQERTAALDNASKLQNALDQLKIELKQAEDDRLTIIEAHEDENRALKAALDDLKRDLERARERLTVHQIKGLFEGSIFSLCSVCDDLLLLGACATLADATLCLMGFLKALRPNSLPRPFDNFARQTLSDLLVKPRQLAGPGSRDEVILRAIECYASLMELSAPRAELFNAAVADLKLFVKLPEARRHAVRILLVPLLQKNPDNEDLLTAYEEVLSSNDDDEVSIALLNLMGFATQLRPSNLARLLETGFDRAIKTWRSCRVAYTTMIRHSPLIQHLGPAHVTELLNRVQTHVKSNLTNMQDQEYQDMGEIIVTIHDVLGGRRIWRPRNRHIVSGGPEVQVRVALAEPGKPSVAGRLRNIAVGGAFWKGGAWISGTVDNGWASTTKWHPGRVTFETSPSITLTCFIRPEDEDTSQGSRICGLRVQWPNITVIDARRLIELVSRYPNLR